MMRGTLNQLLATGVLLCALLSSAARAQPMDPILPLPPPPTYEAPRASELDGWRTTQYGRRLRLDSLVGLGVRASGLWVANDALNRGQGGGGLELLFRLHRRVVLEFSGEFQYGRSASTSVMSSTYERMDVPLMVGLRVYIAPSSWALSPYAIVAAGADYARATLVGVAEESWFGQIDVGGGLEGRVGRRFRLNLELRGYNRIHQVNGLTLYVSDAYGNAVPALRNQYGLLYNLSGSVYF